mgnify:FL=1
MAKKEKVQLTPEEIADRKIRRSNGWTRFWAIFLSFAIVAGVFAFARSQGLSPASSDETTTTVNGGAANASNSSSWDDGSSNGGSSNNASTPASSGNAGSANAGSSDAASVATLINNATKAAVDAKAGYDWERHCTVENIDVGSATNILNKIIQGVDSNSDLNSVVGGFLGRGDKKETCPKGMTLDTIDVKKDDGTTEKLYHGSSYTLKATNLQPNDIQNLSVNGDTYEFTLADSSNPDRSGNTALSRFTNDIVVLDEVNTEIKNFVSVVTVTGLNANYKNIKVKAVITDGKLQSLEYSFNANAELQLKAGLSITGTGNLDANAKYSNFVY